MIKKQIILIGIVVLLIFVVFCGCNEKELSDPLAGLEYVNEEHDFGYNPPSEWYFHELRGIPIYPPFDSNDFTSNNSLVYFFVFPNTFDDFESLQGEPFSFERLVELIYENVSKGNINLTYLEEKKISL